MSFVHMNRPLYYKFLCDILFKEKYKEYIFKTKRTGVTKKSPHHVPTDRE